MPSNANAQRAPEVQLEEHDRINGRTPKTRIGVTDPVTHERQVKVGVEMPVEVVSRDEVIERDGDWVIKVAVLPRTEHGSVISTGWVRIHDANGRQDTADSPRGVSTFARRSSLFATPDGDSRSRWVSRRQRRKPFLEVFQCLAGWMRFETDTITILLVRFTALVCMDPGDGQEGDGLALETDRSEGRPIASWSGAPASYSDPLRYQREPLPVPGGARHRASLSNPNAPFIMESCRRSRYSPVQDELLLRACHLPGGVSRATWNRVTTY